MFLFDSISNKSQCYDMMHHVSALVVRFITRRYIGEYDPTLEKVYTFHTLMDNEMVYFEILDTAGEPHVSFLRNIYFGCNKLFNKYT